MLNAWGGGLEWQGVPVRSSASCLAAGRCPAAAAPAGPCACSPTRATRAPNAPLPVCSIISRTDIFQRALSAKKEFYNQLATYDEDYLGSEGAQTVSFAGL